MNMKLTRKTRQIFPITTWLIMSACLGCIQPSPRSVVEQSVNRMRPASSAVSEPKKIEPLQDEKISIDRFQKNSLDRSMDFSQGLSLNQALLMALESNPGLRVKRYTTVLAGLSEQIEQGEFDTNLYSELSYARDRTREKDAGTWMRAEEQTHTAMVGLARRLPSGTDLDVGISQTLDQSDDASGEEQLRLGITMTQNLLRGYGSAVNLAGIRQARLNTAATLHELRGITEALVADTEIAYWDHVLALQEIDIFENSLDVAKKQLSEVAQRIEIGTLPRVESATAQVEVALRAQGLINAKAKFEESRLRLLFYLLQGEKGDYDSRIQTTSHAPPDPEPEGPAEDHLQLADRFRSDLQEARLRIQQDRLEIVKTRNGTLPRLDLFISLGNSGYADSFSGSFKAFNTDTHDVSGGIRFNRILGNRAPRARDLAAEITLEQTLEAMANLEQIIQRDVRLALNDLDRIRQQIAATRATRVLQEESVTAEQEKFEAGTSTGLLVAQAQRDLLATHIREVEAIIDHQKALVILYLAEGSLLERRGIEMTAVTPALFD